MSLDAKASATHIPLTVRRDETTRSLVILGTIYSTTILVGDANIGILHSEFGLTVPPNDNGMSQFLLIGPYRERRAVLSGQDFFAEALDDVVYARS
jgi:hypothetical protein